MSGGGVISGGGVMTPWWVVDSCIGGCRVMSQTQTSSSGMRVAKNGFH